MIVFLTVKNGKAKVLAQFATHLEADKWWLKHRPENTKRIEIEEKQ